MSPVIKITNYKHDAVIVDSIMSLIKPSYKNAGTHVTKDIDRCNELYMIHSDEGELIAFFMVGYHIIDTNLFCYMGLSACKDEYKNKGIVKLLYTEFQRDCAIKEKELGSKIICYCTTATPIVFVAFHKLFVSVQPSINGCCDDVGKEVLLKIIRKKYSEAIYNENQPFILRQAAKNINYSDQEKERIDEIEKRLGLAIFSANDIRESEGDRILMFGYVG